MIPLLWEELSRDWNLPPLGYFMTLPKADAIGQLLTLLNWSAKVIDYGYYDLKDQVLEELAAAAPSFLYITPSIAYIEGTRQYSYHFFSPAIGDAWCENVQNFVSRKWDGTQNQDVVIDIIWDEYLLGLHEMTANNKEVK